MSKHLQWIWVAIGLVFGPGGVLLVLWVAANTSLPFIEHDQPSKTTELWRAGSPAFVPGPSLIHAGCWSSGCDGQSKAALLEDGSLLLVHVDEGSAERLDSKGEHFTPTGPLAARSTDRSWLLAAPGGAVWLSQNGSIARFRLAANVWQVESWPIGETRAWDRVACAEMWNPSTLMAIVSRRLREDEPLFDRAKDAWATAALLFDIDTGNVTSVTPAPFVTLACALRGPLLVGADGESDAVPPPLVRATTVHVGSDGRVGYDPIATNGVAIRMPLEIVALDQGRYAWWSAGESSSQLFDTRGGRVQETELERSGVPWDSTRALFDGREVLIAGGRARAVADADMVKSVFRFDVATRRLEPLPPLRKGRLGPLVVKLGDGRILIGGGREAVHDVQWLVVTHCLTAWLTALAVVGGLVFLGMKVRPRRLPLAMAIASAVLSLGLTIGALWMLFGMRPLPLF